MENSKFYPIQPASDAAPAAESPAFAVVAIDPFTGRTSNVTFGLSGLEASNIVSTQNMALLKALERPLADMRNVIPSHIYAVSRGGETMDPDFNKLEYVYAGSPMGKLLHLCAERIETYGHAGVVQKSDLTLINKDQEQDHSYYTLVAYNPETHTTRNVTIGISKEEAENAADTFNQSLRLFERYSSSPGFNRVIPNEILVATYGGRVFSDDGTTLDKYAHTDASLLEKARATFQQYGSSGVIRVAPSSIAHAIETQKVPTLLTTIAQQHEALTGIASIGAAAPETASPVDDIALLTHGGRISALKNILATGHIMSVNAAKDNGIGVSKFTDSLGIYTTEDNYIFTMPVTHQGGNGFYRELSSPSESNHNSAAVFDFIVVANAADMLQQVDCIADSDGIALARQDCTPLRIDLSKIDHKIVVSEHYRNEVTALYAQTAQAQHKPVNEMFYFASAAECGQLRAMPAEKMAACLGVSTGTAPAGTFRESIVLPTKDSAVTAYSLPTPLPKQPTLLPGPHDASHEAAPIQPQPPAAKRAATL